MLRRICPWYLTVVSVCAICDAQASWPQPGGDRPSHQDAVTERQRHQRERNPPATPDEVLLKYCQRLQAGGTVIHRGPLVLGKHGATLVGLSRGYSKLIVRPDRGESGGFAAIHVNSCYDTTIRDLVIEVEGEWDYGLLLDRRVKERAAHAARVRDVYVMGKFRNAAVGDYGAEVYVLDGCGFANYLDGGDAVFETRGLHEAVATESAGGPGPDGAAELWSNCNKRIYACSFLARAPLTCIARIGAGTHNIVFRDCEISANVLDVEGGPAIDAMFTVGTANLPDDRTTRSWKVIGRLVIEGGGTHFEGRGVRHFMRLEAGKGQTRMRDLTLRDFNTEYRGDSAFAGFPAMKTMPRGAYEVPVPDPSICEGVWFRKLPRRPSKP